MTVFVVHQYNLICAVCLYVVVLMIPNDADNTAACTQTLFQNTAAKK